jgi:hypothetical protein
VLNGDAGADFLHISELPASAITLDRRVDGGSPRPA